MKKSIILAIFLLVLSVGTIAQAADLTGRWSCNDGGIYYIRQVGDELWWYGEHEDAHHGRPTWSNVAHGKISDDMIYLEWADVPRGEDRGSGMIKLRIDDSDRLARVERRGIWTRRY